MKKFYAILCLTIASLTQLQAQAPQGFNYQATVRNSSGDLIVNTNVYFKFNVIQGSQTAVPIFTETHYVPTDDLGQVNLVIGQGTATEGAFSELDWSLGSYYLGIELNTGNGYVAMGTTQLLSVPYALYAANAGNGDEGIPTLEVVLTENNSANNQQIKDLQDPTEAQDAVTKNYIYSKVEVDALLANLQSQIDALQAATGSGTVTDQDGNTYDYLTYSTQKWTVENAAMETYRDGTPIPQVTDATEWDNLTTGAWAYYDNDPTKPRLYNWYAVMGIHDTDPNTPNKEFSPEGWHVPTDAEWTTLENYLIANGYNYDGSTTTENKIAKAMASNTGWNSSTNTGAIGNDQSLNNSSVFNAFPEGIRNYDGSFANEGNDAIFWSSTENSTENAWFRILGTNYIGLGRVDSYKRDGFSVRFVQGEADPNYADNDNDGYSLNQGDCDDNNAQVNPGAEDLIDGVDNNCDGVIDSQKDNISNLLSGALSNDDIGSSKTWYWQSDTDGFLGVGPVNGTDSSNPIYWLATANDSYRSCSYANEFVFTRVSGGVTFEQSGPVYLDNYFDEFGVSETACYGQQVISSIAGVKNVTFLASTSQPALQGTYYNSGTGSTFTKASMLFSENGFMGHYAGHNLAQIEYEIILISENELVVRFVEHDSNLAWYSRFQTEPSVYNVDDDNDGYTENQGDCDDSNATINPNATEIEDGVDNDCDGLIDNGVITGSVNDIDGNTYDYITYGNQVWTVENAEMVTYRDGTPIPQVTDATEWQNLTTGAWSYYNNDPTKPRLYNWYAVMGIHDIDPNTPNKEFAPQGWHVPSDAEWTTLENYLITNGYNYDGTTTGNKIAKAMASNTGWNSSTNTGAPGNDQSLNNSSGFNAFPEGNRNDDGSFNNEGNFAIFWSSTEYNTSYAWYRSLNNGNSYLYRNNFNKQGGFSVRFVRD